MHITIQFQNISCLMYLPAAELQKEKEHLDILTLQLGIDRSNTQKQNPKTSRDTEHLQSKTKKLKPLDIESRTLCPTQREHIIIQDNKENTSKKTP